MSYDGHQDLRPTKPTERTFSLTDVFESAKEFCNKETHGVFSFHLRGKRIVLIERKATEAPK